MARRGALIAATFLIYFDRSTPMQSSVLHQQAPEKVDLDWLKSQVKRTFAKNEVVQIRKKDRSSQRVTYHAPYLAANIDYPGWLPGWLRWLWKPWCQLKEPWQVRYPHQWFWDSATHAITLSHLDPELAKDEIFSLVYAQDESGFIPHMLWNPKRIHRVDKLLKLLYPKSDGSPFLQPPMLAEAVEQIYQRTNDINFV